MARNGRTILAGTLHIIVMIVIFPIFISGQTITGSIQVKVVDGSGNVIPGAIVILRANDSNVELTRTSDSDGLVEFKGIQPGIYSVTVQVPGFTSATIRNIGVTVASQKTVIANVGLGTTSVVTVEADETAPSLSQLPNLNDDYSPLLQTSIGSVLSGTGALGRVIIDGKGRDSLSYRLDGVDATPLIDVPGADTLLDPGDAVQKPGVATDIDNSGLRSRAFEPRFGPGTGTAVEGVTFGPGKEWAGTIYYDNRNRLFNARNYFEYYGKAGLNRNRFGGRGGGPIGSPNSSIYLGYEGIRGRLEKRVFEAIPVEALCECGVIGPVASILDDYVPYGTTVLPSASLNPSFAVAQRDVRTRLRSDALLLRLDQKLGSTTSLSFRYIPQFFSNRVPEGITGREQEQRLAFNNLLVGVTVLTPVSLVSRFKFGLNGTYVNVSAEDTSDQNGMPPNSAIVISGSVKTIGLTAVTSVPVARIGRLSKDFGRGYRLTPVTRSVGYDGEFTANSRKKHLIAFGVEVRNVRMGLDRTGGITYTFANQQDFRISHPTSTNFLSDLSGISPFTEGTGERVLRQTQLLSYIQVTSKFVDERLSLYYGVRYDYFGGVNEANDRAFIVDPESGKTVDPTSAFFRRQSLNIQPRVGLTYTTKSENTWLKSLEFRAGAGLYLGSPRLGDLLLPVETDRLNTSINGGDFTTTVEDATSAFAANPLTRQFQPLGFSRDFTIPEQLVKWEVLLKRSFSEATALSLSYSGNYGRRLPIARTGNRVINVVANTDPTLPAIAIREFDIVANGQVLKPYGEFFYRTSEGRSDYHAFAASLAKKVGEEPGIPRWLAPKTFSVQYTLSFNRANTNGSVASNSQFLDADYGYNADDARHSVKVSAVYLLSENFEPRWKHDILRGWTITPQLSLRSGTPLSIRIDRPDIVYIDTLDRVFSAPGVGRTPAINVPGGGSSSGTFAPNFQASVSAYDTSDRRILLNPAAFSIPLPGTFGNLGRGHLRGKGSISLDLSISKSFLKKENVEALLRMDAFNILNKANFQNPTSPLPNVLGIDSSLGQLQPGQPYTTQSSGSFGVVTQAGAARQIRFSLSISIQ